MINCHSVVWLSISLREQCWWPLVIGPLVCSAQLSKPLTKEDVNTQTIGLGGLLPTHLISQSHWMPRNPWVLGKKRPRCTCSRLWHLEADGWFGGGEEVVARLRKRHPELCQAFHCCGSGVALTFTNSSHNEGKSQAQTHRKQDMTYTSGSPRRTLKYATVIQLGWVWLLFRQVTPSCPKKSLK